MSEVPNQTIEIKFDTDRFTKFITHIAYVSNVVTATIHATKDRTVEQLTPLETDGLAIVFSDKDGNSEVSAKHISDWVFKKAFEDLIVGMTQSLVEIAIYLGTASLAETTKDNPFPNETAAREAIEKISIKSKTANVPTLLDTIEKLLNTPLILRNEVESINKVRNCFVHHESRVKEVDGLMLKYVKQQMHAQVNGELFPVTVEFKSKRTQVEALYYGYLAIDVPFKTGEKITVSADIFKDVTWTCIWFFQEMIRKMPLTDEVKNLLAPLPVIKIAVEDMAQ